MTATLDLSKKLINCPSITPEDAGCQEILASRLAASGFAIKHLPSGKVNNLWAQLGDSKPLMVFAGHTDVVPSGDLKDWHSPPFTATIRDDHLYGRGAADMKCSLAAMVVACEQFLQQHPDVNGSIGFLITSAEEGDDYHDGTPHVLRYLASENIKMDYCVIGEPSSSEATADTIRVGRRGSLSGKLIVQGKQGHVAYPDLANNPLPIAAKIIADLSAHHWDDGNQHFPPSSLQVTNVHAGTGAGNVIPGSVEIDFNIRYCTESTAEELQQQIIAIIEEHKPQYELSWSHSGEPFLTHDNELIEFCQTASKQVMGKACELSTSGGTSDGRFIAPTGTPVVELGPRNATIHQVDECVHLDELDSLTAVYYQVLVECFKGK